MLVTAAAVAGTAGAATAARAAPGAVITTSSQAGYVTGGGRHFRFIQTTVQVSPARTATQFAGIVLGGKDHPVPQLYLVIKAGGGASSVSWTYNNPPPFTSGERVPLAKLAPSVGDMVRLSIYYDRGGYLYFTAVDTTKGVSQTQRVEAFGPVDYYSAAEAAVFAFGYTAPVATDFKLWAFSGTHVTTFSGVRGSLLGPWTTSKVVAVNASGTVVMSPSVLADSGHAFNVWRR